MLLGGFYSIDYCVEIKALRAFNAHVMIYKNNLGEDSIKNPSSFYY